MKIEKTDSLFAYKLNDANKNGLRVLKQPHGGR